MIKREIFPNPPLRLVSLELRFPVTSRILTRSLWDALEEAIGELLPDVELLMPDALSSVPRGPKDAVLRRISRDQKTAVTLYAGSLTIEVSEYQRYEDLRALTELTLTAFGGEHSISKWTRLGLRYINEIKSEFVLDKDAKWQRAASWRPFVHKDLVRDLTNTPDTLCAYAHRGIAYFHAAKNKGQASLDYGIHPEGLVSDGVLALRGFPGPCFVLDIDASHYRLDDEKEQEEPNILGTLDDLHELIGEIFQWAITERSREAFNVPVTDDSESLLSTTSC
jgi:uncharacterized protein (TIGR04255 family)